MLGTVQKNLLRTSSSLTQVICFSSNISACCSRGHSNLLQSTTTQWTPTGKQKRCIQTSSCHLASKDYYKVLEVDKKASAKDIKKAYFQMAKKFHPDVNKTKEAQERFQEISEAYEILSDEGKRRNYDTYGTAGDPSMGQQGQQGFHGAAGGANHYQDMFRDIFNFGKPGFSWNMYSDSSFGGSHAEEIELSVTFEEAARGVSKNVNINVVENCQSCGGTQVKPGYKKVPCPYCNGHGVISQRVNGGFFFQMACNKCNGTGSYNKDPCLECVGKGKTVQRKQVTVSIPAGVCDKEQLQMKVGETIVLIHCKVLPSSRFKRVGDDVHCDVEASIGQAVLGGSIKIPGVYEDTFVRIPPGTNSHTKMKLTGKGIKRLSQSGYGDQYINIKIVVPKYLKAEQKKLISLFAKTENLPSGTVDLETPPSEGANKKEKPSESPRREPDRENGKQERRVETAENVTEEVKDSEPGFLGKLKKSLFASRPDDASARAEAEPKKAAKS